MKDIQITLDSFKKFTGNIFMIDNIPEISIYGNANGECEFVTELNIGVNLKNADWDVYLTSIFIGGYKMEQYAHPGCLFNNRIRWDGVRTPTRPSAAGNVYADNHGISTDSSGDIVVDGNGVVDSSGALTDAHIRAKNENFATQSIFKNNLKGGYKGIFPTSGGIWQADITNHTPTYGNKQTTFKNETIQAFVISIVDGQGNEYTNRSNFIGAYPINYKNWYGDRDPNAADTPDGVKTFDWESKDDVAEDMTHPNKITGGLILMNNQKQRNDGFLSAGASTNQPQDKVVHEDTGGSLTVQDYVPFIYDERENNPIYLTTLKDGHKVRKIKIKITDQDGHSIWGPAHVSQMKNEFGIDANPPTESRRIIIKLTYKPKIKDKLLETITKLNDNIEKLINPS